MDSHQAAFADIARGARPQKRQKDREPGAAPATPWWREEIAKRGWSTPLPHVASAVEDALGNYAD